MLHLFVEPLFKFGKEDGAPLLLETVGSQLDHKIINTEHAMIEHVQDHRIYDDRPKLFHQIERQSRTPVKGAVQVAHKVVETYQLYCAGYLVGQQRVPKAQQRIHWISRRTLHSSWERPLSGITQQLAEAAKVGRTACPFHAQNRFQRGACYTMIPTRQLASEMCRIQWQRGQLMQQRIDLLNGLPHLSVVNPALVALQHGALIHQFADDKAPRQFAASRHILMRTVLCHAQDRIFGKWGGKATFELPVLAQKRDLDVAFQQQMDGRCRQRDLSQHHHLIYFDEWNALFASRRGLYTVLALPFGNLHQQHILALTTYQGVCFSQVEC